MHSVPDIFDHCVSSSTRYAMKRDTIYNFAPNKKWSLYVWTLWTMEPDIYMEDSVCMSQCPNKLVYCESYRYPKPHIAYLFYLYIFQETYKLFIVLDQSVLSIKEFSLGQCQRRRLEFESGERNASSSELQPTTPSLPQPYTPALLQPTSANLHMTAGGGRSSFVSFPGANSQLSIADIPFSSVQTSAVQFRPRYSY